MANNSLMITKKQGAYASILMAAAFLAAHWIYFSGNLRDAAGPLAYSLADLLYGPVWGAGLVISALTMCEYFGEQAPRRMNLAFLVTLLAAAAFLTVACIRAANRGYHLAHPDLHLESSATVLIVWTTLVAGVIGAAWHLLGWAWILIGSAGWSSRRLPRAMSAAYLAAGGISLFVYVFPEFEGAAILLAIILSVWQGILFWRVEPHITPRPESAASQPNQA